MRVSHAVVASVALMLAAGMAQASFAQACGEGEIYHDGRCVADEREKPNTMNLAVEKKEKDADQCAAGTDGDKCRQSAAETDKIFDDGDTIVLTGTVSSFTEKSAVAIIVRDASGNIAHIGQVTPTKSSSGGGGSETNPRAIPGSFKVEIKAVGPTWKGSGDYTVTTKYGTDISVIEFPFTGSIVGGGSSLTAGGGTAAKAEEKPAEEKVEEKVQETLKVLEVLDNGYYVIAESQIGLVAPASLRGPAPDGVNFTVDPSAIGDISGSLELPPPKPVVENLVVKKVLDDGLYVISEDQSGLVAAASLRGPAPDGDGLMVDPASIGLPADRVVLPAPEPEKPDPEPEKPVPTPQCGPGTVPDENGICQLVETTDRSNGCLVATAAYGSEFAPQVQALREVRDGALYSTGAGASFMAGFNDVYYAFSPAVADLQREHPALNEAVRALITPMLASLSIMSLAEPGSESDVLGYGIAVIALNLGMYAGAPAAAIVAARRAAGRR